jgi:outer membrane cobalamin receptor
MKYAAAMCICAALVFAGDEDRTNIPMYTTEEVVVIARVPQQSDDLPLDILRIDGKTILRRDPNLAGDALRGEASVDVRSYGFPGSASTISLRGATTSQTLVLLDGRPLNSLTLGTADLSAIPLEALDRIELVKSPTSSIWGANALGGTVNLVTQDAPERNGLSGQFGIGSNELSTSLLRAGFRSGPIGGWVSGHYKNSMGDRTNGHNFGYGILGKVSVDIPAHPTVTAGYSAIRQGVPGPLPGEVIPKYGDSTASSIFDKQADTTAFLDLNLSEELSESFTLRGRGYWDERVMRFFTVYDIFDEFWAPCCAYEDDRYRTRALGGTTMIEFSHGEGFKGTLGADVRRNSLNAFQEVVDSLDAQITETEWVAANTEVGVFGSATVRLNERWNAFASLRYDRNEDYGDFLSPGGGVVFEPTDIYRLKLYAGRAFRAPSFNDLYWPIYGNEDLMPEEGTAFEATMEIEPSERIGLKISGFYRNTENLIAWTPDTTGFWRPSNVNEARVRGGEITVEMLVSKDLRLTLNGAYNTGTQRNRETIYSDWFSGETRFETIERDLAFLPGYNATIEMDWTSPLGLHLNLRALSTGERVNYYADYSTVPDVGMLKKTLESYVLLNAFLGYEIIKGIEMFLWGTNLLDENYEDQFGTSMEDLDFPRPGRTIGAGIRFSIPTRAFPAAR